MNIQEIRSCMHHFEETIFLGKEMEASGVMVLVAGICREEKKLQMYLFSEGEDSRELQRKRREVEGKRQRGTLTKRQELLAELEENQVGLLDGIRGIVVDGKPYEFCSAWGSGMEECSLEGRVLVYQFLSNQVPFGFLEEQDFSRMQYAVMELEGEFEEIPFSRQELESLEFLLSPRYHHIPVKQKMKLPLGVQSGRMRKFLCGTLNREICYCINSIALVDTLEEYQKAYDKRGTQRKLPKEEEEMLFNHLRKICPPRMRNLQITYECEEAGLEFYTKGQLQEKVQVQEGSATAFFLAGRAEEKVGIHGQRLKVCLVPYPVKADTQEVELELLRAMVKE